MLAHPLKTTGATPWDLNLKVWMGLNPKTKQQKQDFLGFVWNPFILLKLKLFAESTVDKGKS